MTQTEKKPDWIVYYRDLEEGDEDTALVFGFDKIEEALAEATATLGSGYEEKWFDILGIVKASHKSLAQPALGVSDE